MKIIDISIPLNKNTVLWPGSQKVKLKRLADMAKGNNYNENSLEMGLHSGTHLDAPLHFTSKGKPIDRVALEKFIGPVVVVDLPKVKKIEERDLNKIKLPKGTERILFKTSNSLPKNRKNSKFRKNYVSLTQSAARWIIKNKIKLVGIDYLSIADFKETVEVHNILLGAEVAVLENIDLSKVKAGEYELVCLPLNITGAEASPTRAVLLR